MDDHVTVPKQSDELRKVKYKFEHASVMLYLSMLALGIGC